MEEAVLSKIQKLLNMTQANGASVHEAEVAAAAAQRLMTQHRISVSDLKPYKEEEISNKRFIYSGERVVQWKSWLGQVIAEVNGCKTYIGYENGIRKNGREGHLIKIRVIGRDSDVQIVDYFFNYLVREVERFCKALNNGRGKTWSNSFKMGATRAIVDRLRAAHEQVKTESGSQAIVKLDMRQAEIDEWAKKLNLRDVKNASNINWNANAYIKGKEIGEKIQLNKGVSGKTAGDTKLLGAINMTKKHFEYAANMVKNSKASERDKYVMADAFVELFMEFNDRFDKERFLKACEFKGKRYTHGCGNCD